jgi:ribose/xylose/arabinose/galactoside ABC-type transport system permease subunit
MSDQTSTAGPVRQFDRNAERRAGMKIVGRAAQVVARARETRVYGPLIALWVVLALITPTFVTVRNVSNLLFEAAEVGILAVGTTPVILTGEIDLSLGAVEGLSGVVAAVLIIQLHMAWPIGVVVAIAAAAAIGVINGWCTVRFRVPSFVVTLATLSIATGIADLMSGGQSIFGFPTGYLVIGQGSVGSITAPVFITFGAAVLLHLFLKNTRGGLNVYGVGSNERAAALIGIRTRLVKVYVFAISGAAAGIAGILVSAELNSANPEFGTTSLLNAIAAVVIGGASLLGGSGSIAGTVGGVLVIATLENGLDLLNVGPFWQEFTVGAVILVVVALGATRFRTRRRWARRLGYRDDDQNQASRPAPPDMSVPGRPDEGLSLPSSRGDA